MLFRIDSLVGAAWVVVVAGGIGSAWRYESTAGRAAPATDWPRESALVRDAERPTILTFLHPNCPCTRAGLEETAELARRNAGVARWIFVVVGAKGLGGDLDRSTNGRLARLVDGSTVVIDGRGEEARRFGAATSGQTFAYASDGRLAFRGGVTSARGHFGPSAGMDALDSVLRGTPPERFQTPVYGCPLVEGVQ